jgi:putative sugar O-methyltransferase
MRYNGRVTREALDTTIEAARQSDEFRAYLSTREWVLELLADRVNEADTPSAYWREELAGFDYMLDASPLVVRKLREHAYHFTSVRPYDYRSHHARQVGPFAERLRALRQKDPRGLFVPESPRLGGFGHEIDGQLVNLDTLRYYECLIAMERAGFLDAFRGGDVNRPLLLEIGGGWGGFAFQFKCLHPHACCVIVDFPEAFLFSAVYLATMFPAASVMTVGPGNDPGQDWVRHDFVFVPHYLFHRLRLPSIDLAVNIASFQEMTTTQVSGYVAGLAKTGCTHLYSFNRDRSAHNDQLSSVRRILAQRYDLTELSLLDSQYGELHRTKVLGTLGRARERMKGVVRRAIGRPHQGYRHLAGRLDVTGVTSAPSRQSRAAGDRQPAASADPPG